MQTDQRGLTLTTQSAEAAHLFDETIISNLEYRTGTAAKLKAMLKADPEFVMGQTLKGYLLMLFGSSVYLEGVAKCLDFCEPLRDTVTRREANHIRALRVWHDGDLVSAERTWDEILVAHPHDLLALRLQHFANFYMGRSQGMRDACL